MMQLTKLEFTFIPAGLITKDDPTGDRAFLAWKAIINGKQYGDARHIGKVNDLQPNDWAEFIDKALVQVNEIRKMTPEEAEKLKP